MALKPSVARRRRSRLFAKLFLLRPILWVILVVCGLYAFFTWVSLPLWDRFIASREASLNQAAVERVRGYHLLPIPTPIVIDHTAELTKQNAELKAQLEALTKEVRGL